MDKVLLITLLIIPDYRQFLIFVQWAFRMDVGQVEGLDLSMLLALILILFQGNYFFI